VLCSLDMMGNRMDSEGSYMLGQALVTNEALMNLNLRLNNLGHVGGSVLLEWNVSRRIKLYDSIRRERESR